METRTGSANASRTMLLTAIAMLAFAANSLICRLALGNGDIDAASFTLLRVVSGAVMLGIIVLPKWRSSEWTTPDWRAAAMLFVYMVFFSFAYLSLSAGTGALILFGAVQLTMFAAALRSGEQFSFVSWCGLMLAIGGLIYLVSPGVTAPDPIGAVLMALAGVGWGAYSLLGRRATDALMASAGNFFYCVPLTVVTSLVFIRDVDLRLNGALLALASGAIASGLGYVIWYAALRGLSAARAATVQLSVPVIAAFGGVLLLGEALSLRLLLAAIATLGGVAIVLSQRAQAD